MAGLTRDMILALQQTPATPQREAVPCPEWGEETVVYVRMMSSAAAETYERYLYKTNQSILDALETLAETDRPLSSVLSREDAESTLFAAPSIRVALVLQAACDDAGQALFTMADEAWLSEQPAPVVKRLFDAAWKLNQLGAEAVDAAVKNSASSQSSDSGTSLHSNGVVLSASSSNN